MISLAVTCRAARPCGPVDPLHVLAPQADHGLAETVERPRRSSASFNDAIPAALVKILITQVGLEESQVAEMTKQQAIDRVNRYWIEGE